LGFWVYGDGDGDEYREPGDERVDGGVVVWWESDGHELLEHCVDPIRCIGDGDEPELQQRDPTGSVDHLRIQRKLLRNKHRTYTHLHG
jgi:hypothetical protein